MKILAIDFGLSTVGLAISSNSLAEPLGQKRYQALPQLIDYLARLCHQQQVSRLVIGLSENHMAAKTKHFGSQLQSVLNLPVVYQDETLSTHEAKQKLLQAHAPQKKRRQDHSAAAAVILQNYLDRQSTLS